jgi:hypothetical protein
MRRFLRVALLGVGLVLAGCVMTTGPVISKSKLGNLQIDVTFPQGCVESNADVYLDGAFIGNVSANMPVIYARRGPRVVRVEAPGCEPFEKTIAILGDPNHQMLDIRLKAK